MGAPGRPTVPGAGTIVADGNFVIRHGALGVLVRKAGTPTPKGIEVTELLQHASATSSARSSLCSLVRWQLPLFYISPVQTVTDYSRLVGEPESAGINRHVVGDARALQERK
jgi:hypothetical protein